MMDSILVGIALAIYIFVAIMGIFTLIVKGDAVEFRDILVLVFWPWLLAIILSVEFWVHYHTDFRNARRKG